MPEKSSSQLRAEAGHRVAQQRYLLVGIAILAFTTLLVAVLAWYGGWTARLLTVAGSLLQWFAVVIVLRSAFFITPEELSRATAGVVFGSNESLHRVLMSSQLAAGLSSFLVFVGTALQMLTIIVGT